MYVATQSCVATQSAHSSDRTQLSHSSRAGKDSRPQERSGKSFVSRWGGQTTKRLAHASSHCFIGHCCRNADRGSGRRGPAKRTILSPRQRVGSAELQLPDDGSMRTVEVRRSHHRNLRREPAWWNHRFRQQSDTRQGRRHGTGQPECPLRHSVSFTLDAVERSPEHALTGPLLKSMSGVLRQRTPDVCCESADRISRDRKKN